MDQRQEHVLAKSLEFDGNLGTLAPCEDKAVRRNNRNDAGSHPVLFGKALRAASGWIGKFIIPPHQLEWCAGGKPHLAGSQPAAAKVAFRQIGPHPFDRPRQQPLDLQGRRFNEATISVRHCNISHCHFLHLQGFFPDLPP